MNVARVLSLFLLSSSAFSSTLSGTVTDSEGAVIAGAHVVIHWDSSGSNYLKDNIGVKQDIVLTSDRDGNFSVDIPPGFYDIFVSATAFSPHCEKLRVKGDQRQLFKVRLKVSYVTNKELD